MSRNSLLADGRLLHQLLAKDYPLVAPLQALLYNRPREADHAARHHEALVVEVCHYKKLDAATRITFNTY
jgi:hypothetical protein